LQKASTIKADDKMIWRKWACNSAHFSR